MSTITAANSTFLLAIGGIFPIAQQLQGFAADSAFAFDSVDPAELVMGVDGKLSAGYVPFMTVQTVSIMPDSPSLSIFDTWQAAQNTAREIFFANATIIIPAIGRKYTLTRGALSSAKAAPDVKKVLSSLEYKITWESVAYALI